jgi:transmembrane sensor
MSNGSEPRDDQLIQWVRDHRAPGEPSFSADSAWRRFEATHHLATAPRPWYRHAGWRSAAAVVLIAASLPVAWRMMGTRTVERIAANGERAIIELADGSRITLNGGSSLRYPARASGNVEVALDGEALFEVRHDSTRTFRVRTAVGTVEDMGTRFTVRAYRSDERVDVVVTEGAVALTASQGSPLRLEAGAGGAIIGGVAQRLAATEKARRLAWLDGTIILDAVPLRDAIRELEHAYGIAITIADPALAARPVTARLAHETPERAIAAISLSLGADYVRDNGRFTIKPAAQ